MRTDHTQIENTFIRDFMPSASGDAVKVYLLGFDAVPERDGPKLAALRLPTALSLSEQDVADAFMYWQDCGLVRISHQSFLFGIVPIRPPRHAAGYFIIHAIRSCMHSYNRYFCLPPLRPAN